MQKRIGNRLVSKALSNIIGEKIIDAQTGFRAFSNDALAKLSEELNIPIIASGGAGTVQHFVDTFKEGKADAALAASVFHKSLINIQNLKEELDNSSIEVRL